jgi:hypothetical protein
MDSQENKDVPSELQPSKAKGPQSIFYGFQIMKLSTTKKGISTFTIVNSSFKRHRRENVKI